MQIFGSLEATEPEAVEAVESEQCDEATIPCLFLSPAVPCLKNNLFTLKIGEK
jgi:hypothetical protein